MVLAPGGPARSFALEPLRLPLGRRGTYNCPSGFGARRPCPELPLLGRSPRAVASPVGSTSNLTWNPGVSQWLWRPEALPGASPVGSKSSSRCVSRWVDVKPNCPSGFGARRPCPELRLLGRSPRAVASPVGSTSNLTWNPGVSQWFWRPEVLAGGPPNGKATMRK